MPLVPTQYISVHWYVQRNKQEEEEEKKDTS